MNSTTLDLYNDGEEIPENLEGNMSVPNSGTAQVEGNLEFNTLDEPIKTTVMRDLKAVGVKFQSVLYPKEKKSLLKEWDLWGPLLLCTFMAMILQGSSDDINHNDGGPEFAEVFVIVWIGAMVVTLNSKLLGGNISFFQSVCVLGYCLLPTVLALIACRIILMATQSTTLFILRLIATLTGFGWATYGQFHLNFLIIVVIYLKRRK
ncbi:Hypothetical predicted protein [Cloeon dipterum]|uniref:Protein YIPF n=1 Tax=Cloeon dipterum TaxID=197152 RepID=A0A8S1CCI6_9INSE|nr:Hypothetical predicted protein [Cloeon dipterum]